MRTRPRNIGPIVAAAMAGAVAVAAASYFQPYPALSDRALLEPSAAVRVERGPQGLGFLPAGESKRVGLVFYAGARVPPEAYASLARACAEAGYVAVLPSFPLHYPPFGADSALRAASAYPAVERWVLGGHALGGAVAASFAEEASGGAFPGGVAGLFLVAAYPGGGTDLSSSAIPAVSLSGAKDGLVTPGKLARGRRRMPAGARFVEIAGANHAQFGDYGPESGDGSAEISGPAQRGALAEEAVAFLRGVGSAAGR